MHFDGLVSQQLWSFAFVHCCFCRDDSDRLIRVSSLFDQSAAAIVFIKQQEAQLCCCFDTISSNATECWGNFDPPNPRHGQSGVMIYLTLVCYGVGNIVLNRQASRNL